MDFIEGLPKSAGKDSILVVVDKLTKYCHLFTFTHTFIAHKVAQEFLNQVFKLHGTTITIISNRDPTFVISFGVCCLNLWELIQKLSSAYHP